MDFEKEIHKFMPMREFEFNVNISIKHKHIYIEVAKPPCSTIKRRLMDFEVFPYHSENQIVHADIFSTPFVKPYQLDQHLLEHILFSDEYFKFSFVREPYTRFLSAYLDKIVRLKPQVKNVLSALNLPSDDKSTSQADRTGEVHDQPRSHAPGRHGAQIHVCSLCANGLPGHEK